MNNLELTNEELDYLELLLHNHEYEEKDRKLIDRLEFKFYQLKEKESIIDFYMPPHDQQGFASLLACFPFFITKKVAEIKMDEQLKHLYGQNILFKASMKYIINHIPKSLFNLKSREIDLESDMEYIRANN